MNIAVGTLQHSALCHMHVHSLNGVSNSCRKENIQTIHQFHWTQCEAILWSVWSHRCTKHAFQKSIQNIGHPIPFFQRTNCELPQTVTFSALTVGLQAQQFILSIYVNQCHDMRALGLICWWPAENHHIASLHLSKDWVSTHRQIC